MIEDNLKLVHYVLHKLNIKQDYEDYFQIGCIGLIKAERAYKEEKGKFSTFAIYCIRNEVIDELKKKRVKTVPIDYINNKADANPYEAYEQAEVLGQAIDKALEGVKQRNLIVQYIEDIKAGEQNISALAKEYGISNQAAHKTIKNFKNRVRCIYNEGQE